MEMRMNSKLIIPAILLLAACQQMELAVPTPVTNPEELQQLPDSLFTLTVKASKDEVKTRALDLINDGATLNTYWKNTEKVKVYKDGTLLGTLDVAPAAGEKPTKATLSGPIATAGLTAGNLLTLRIPLESWDYTGQVGTLSSIETTYDYAIATVTVATVDDVFHAVTTTGSANFQNQQSIYRFGFKTGGNYFDPKSFTVSAAGGKLVRSMSWNGSVWMPAYGDLTVAPESPAGDHFYYVSLRNDQTTDDVYSFTITGSDDVLYMATKTIPASVLDVPGRFISAKNISATKPDFSPASGSGEEVTDPLEVL